MLLFAGALLSSCSDWLDVQPESQIDGKEFFSNEQGYKDALNGVYINLASASLYGRNMTYGMVDVLGGMYYNVGSSGAYYYLKNHDYTNSSAESMINNVWSRAYTTIANLNEQLINQLNAADSATFSTDNYHVIKGEALGLRAFLHFDLLRLFAPSCTAGNDSTGIPYVTTYSYNPTPSGTVSENITQIINDLKAAELELKNSDPIVTGRKITADEDNGYLEDRQYHFNYYAVLAELARVYLYSNDYDNARLYAQKVIDSGKFTWTPVERIATSVEADRDRTFTSEQIFALQEDDLDDYILPFLTGTDKTNVMFTLNSSWLKAIWPTSTHSTDWRRTYFFSSEHTSYGMYYTCTKLWQEGMTKAYVGRMPIMRLPEMYLILAECDLPGAAKYLNIIRQHRGVTVPVAAKTDNDLRNEITLEYIREFQDEGQVFYHYKRTNAKQQYSGYTFRLTNVNPQKVYVLPLPESEIEFGNRENNVNND